MTYRTLVVRPAETEGLVLTLGEGANQVFVVRLNGRTLGTVWCAPWEVVVPSDVWQEEANRLEIDVTNSWRNRLIGDEQEPTDCAWEPGDLGGGKSLAAYPDWFRSGLVARPSAGRRCFTTWNYFTKDSPLRPAGLIGPVRLQRR